MAIDIDDPLADLWPHGDSLDGEQVQLLADGARDDALAATVRFGKLDHFCLFGEPLRPALRAAAPTWCTCPPIPRRRGACCNARSRSAMPASSSRSLRSPPMLLHKCKIR